MSIPEFALVLVTYNYAIASHPIEPKPNATLKSEIIIGAVFAFAVIGNGLGSYNITQHQKPALCCLQNLVESSPKRKYVNKSIKHQEGRRLGTCGKPLERSCRS